MDSLEVRTHPTLLETLTSKYVFGPVIIKLQGLSRNGPQGRVVQSPIKLTQSKREFWFQFCNFLVRCPVYIVCPSVLSCSYLKLHQTLDVKNIFKEEKIIAVVKV